MWPKLQKMKTGKIKKSHINIFPVYLQFHLNTHLTKEKTVASQRD